MRHSTTSEGARAAGLVTESESESESGACVWVALQTQRQKQPIGGEFFEFVKDFPIWCKWHAIFCNDTHTL